MKKWMVMVLVVSLSGLPAISIAEESADKKTGVATLEEVVVTATKTEEKRGDIANAVTLLDFADIDTSPAQSLGELLANEQGIDWRTRGDYGGAAEEIHIRGMSGIGTQVLVEGMVVNSPSLGSADAGLIPLHSIESIEVVRGAGSLLYGTGATGGTVNIMAKRPEKGATDFNIGAGYGTNSAWEIFAEHGRYLSDNFGYYLTAAATDTDGFRDNGDEDRQELTVNLVYTEKDRLDISLYADYTDRDYGQPGPATPEGASDFVVNGITFYNSESSNLLSHGANEDLHWVLNIKSSPLDWLDINAKASFMDLESFTHTRYYTSWPTAGLPGTNTTVTNTVSAVEASADFQPIEALSFLTGAEVKHYEWENAQTDLDGNGNAITASEDSTREDLDTLGLFIEGQYRPSKYVKAMAGVRREHHSEFGTEYVPRYGVVFNPHQATAIKLNYGEHYNAPTPNDLFWPYEDWGFGMGTQGNTDLKPETGTHMDLTFEQSLADNVWFINASLFKWDIEDKIRWAPDANYFYQPENLDTYEGRGVELEVAFKPIKGAALAVSYTYSDAEEELEGGTSRQALYTSDNYFRANARYAADMGLTISATLRYTGDRPAYYQLDTDVDPQVELDSYWTVDLRLEQRFKTHWVVSLSGNNLLDEAYDTYVQSFRNQVTGMTTMERYPGAGRSFFLGVSYEY